jgi:hypothetical protein
MFFAHYDLLFFQLLLVSLQFVFVLVRELSFFELMRQLLSRENVEGTKNVVNVDRADVLDGGYRAFRRAIFIPQNRLSVRFGGEFGIDTGGLTKEFLRLALVAIQQSSIFCGPDNARNLQLDYKGYLSRKFNLIINANSKASI